MLGAKVLKRLLAEKKTEGSLCARVLKSSDGRQYNGKRDREERQARHDRKRISGSIIRWKIEKGNKHGSDGSDKTIR